MLKASHGHAAAGLPSSCLFAKRFASSPPVNPDVESLAWSCHCYPRAESLLTIAWSCHCRSHCHHLQVAALRFVCKSRCEILASKCNSHCYQHGCRSAWQEDLMGFR
ncbi:hypothetical protein P692DRAFT_2039447 [Suillus brevipes Sb2]|nr:hypothetical protein P692DRAFT_2039447 [Suillus brevipes Sb2]